MERPKLQDFNSYKSPNTKKLAHTLAMENYIDYLEKLLKVTEENLEDQHRVIDEIPECKTHGRCIPHAIDWIKDKKQK